MGASLVNLPGNDFSAFCVSKQVGGIVLNKVAKDSAAAQAGLHVGDVIQNISGQSVSNLRQLNQTLKRTRRIYSILNWCAISKSLNLCSKWIKTYS
ncbi:hypothetical protein B5G52_06870 [Pseudoalteromonas sp. A601]|uniref:PDZ domain-containing protein n=1 Tax=Pseudoalteromonas sp. A601 TaxID=1967839 RepID=UPI000B3CDD61|nr:PDZ domain-containing protein [Pseudoalteromonas sp. A601]OUS72898.1 hypothetical protein B5G52_06870 [Pseudoalteromonas sp. A601]